MLEFHRDRRAAVTVAVTEVPEHLADQFGILEIDPRGRVIGFQEKPEPGTARTSCLDGRLPVPPRGAQMALAEDAEDPSSTHDFGKDILPRLVARGIEVYAYRFPHYWQDVGTLDPYYQTNLELVSDRPPIELADPEWIVHTVSLDRPPVRVGRAAAVLQTLAANGVRVDGRSERSILFPGVVIEPGAVVRDSILMHDARVGAGAIVERVIADKGAWIGAGSRVGGPHRPASPRTRSAPSTCRAACR